MAEATNVEKKPSFWSNLVAEFKKVVWPDRATAAKKAVLVIVGAVCVGAVVKLLDTGLQILLQLIA